MFQRLSEDVEDVQYSSGATLRQSIIVLDNSRRYTQIQRIPKHLHSHVEF